MTEKVAEVSVKDMTLEGNFTCPKCRMQVDPELETVYEILEVDETFYEYILMKHCCGQKIKIITRDDRPIDEQIPFKTDIG